jgi:predicted enzyme related to lactoylglutathione lyase
MPERDGYIPGVPCWIDTSQPDPGAAVEFYRGLFGWEFEDVMPPGSEGKYFLARLRGSEVAAVGSIPESTPSMAMWDTYVAVDNADETASKVRESGGAIVKGPFDVMDSGRMGVFTDPEGAVFCVWQAKSFKGARVVNEPGSLNFNSLNTRDVEGAKSFYGSVFGWETLTVEGGFEMWTLPGYGDYLERDDPDLRKRVGEIGGTMGFEDVVASINPIADDQPDVPAHWGVTFAVDDADAIARKATELGGKVVVPPFDAPWVRMTVVTDPQGATFIASKFVPENKELGSQADAVGAA